MPPQVDVFVTEAELAEGKRTKKTACLNIEPSALAPVLCVSKQGISTAALFDSRPKRQEGRYLTDAEMGLMYEKFVGPSSLNNAALRHEHYERGGSTGPSSGAAGSPSAKSRAPSIDSGDRTPPPPPPGLAVAMAAAGAGAAVQTASQLAEHFAQRQEQLATRKYVAPNIARKYSIEQHIRPASAIAAAAAAVTVAGGSGGSGAAVTAAVGRNRGGSGGSAAAAASPRSYSSTPRSATVASDATPPPAAADVHDARPPRPPSAAFKAVARERAKCNGTKFLYGGPSGVPGPAKYTPKYSAIEKDSHALAWSRSAGAPLPPGSTAAADSGGVTAGAGAGERLCAWRPGPAPATATGRSRPGSAPFPSRRRDAAGDAAAATAAEPTAGGRGSLSRSRSLGTAARHAELFAGAHRVHPRKPPRPPGTQPFLASERRTPDAVTTGGHLFGEYYKDGYDRLTRRSSRPSSAFGHQTSRPAILPGSLPAHIVAHGETGAALGPGAYGAKGELPGTNTGRHVTAGHSPLARTSDWGRASSRPCSAPPARPPSASPPATAVQQGYWGSDGPAASLWPDDPEYTELVALRLIQEQVAQGEVSQAQRRHSSSRPVSAAYASPHADSAAAAAPGGEGAGQQPLVYVDPQRHGELISTGLARRVPGGAFGKATREAAAHAMRAMSDNRVTAPGSVAVKAVQDLTYSYDYNVEAHRGRPPAWGLPPNRAALSAKWVGAAASALLETMAN